MLLQRSTCADGAAEQGAKRTPLPSSLRTVKAKPKREITLHCSIPSVPASPLTLDDPSWFDHASLVDAEDLLYSQATTLYGNDGTNHTNAQSLNKPATRIKIVGRWANHSKEIQGRDLY